MNRNEEQSKIMFKGDKRVDVADKNQIWRRMGGAGEENW